MATTKLGVRGQTGEASGERPLSKADVNSVGVVGLFARQFSELVTISAGRDLEWIAGGYQVDKSGRIQVDSLLNNARGVSLNLHIASWRAADAAQAAIELQDSRTTPAGTLRLRDAYRSQNSAGRWANDTGARVQHVTKVSTRVRSATAATATEIPVYSVQGIQLADIVVIHREGTGYARKITGINAGTRTITLDSADGHPAFQDQDAVEIRAFQLIAYRRDFSGVERQIALPQNSDYLSLEPDHPTDYAITKLQTHPLFRGEDMASAANYVERFPAESLSYLENGSDGTPPATVSDWANLQSRFAQVRLFIVTNTDSQDADVHSSWRDWAMTRDDHPQYFGALPFVGENWQMLEDYAEPLLRPDGWNQISAFYGYRYWPDPTDASPYKARRISVHSAVLGAWMHNIYHGDAHLSLAEVQYSLIGFVPGGEDLPEDGDAIETSMNGSATIRERLYDVGINMVRRYRGAVRVRNFRSMAQEAVYRDLHIHAISQILKFTSEDDLQDRENVPLKRKELKRIIERLGLQMLKPMHEGQFPPYVVTAEVGPGNGAFVDKDAEDNALQWHEVARVVANQSNNPQSTFQQGDAFAAIQFMTFASKRSLTITTSPSLNLPGGN